VDEDRDDVRVRQASDRLRALGQRVTPARVAVATVLARTTEHLGAAEIADRCAALDPGIHRATVYRALSTLTELEVVSHTHTSAAGAVYHLPGSVAPAGHAHLECTSCARIVDVPAALLTDLSEAVGSTYGFTLEPDHATLLGTCADCSGRKVVAPRAQSPPRFKGSLQHLLFVVR
jgi:Fur family transcriptional regulator, ferric uptake regulator